MKYCNCSLMGLAAILVAAQLSRATDIDTVPVGNPANAADNRYYQNVGSVVYPFKIGRTEVTNAQYVAFLNAVAASDLYGLYDTRMASGTLGGIVRSGAAGNYNYAVKTPALGGVYAYDNKPVNFVAWQDAARFANWLHNGQPAGPESAVTTEDGAYTLNWSPPSPLPTRKPNALWWIPSQNEWYKAAYYNPVMGTYYEFPTSSSSVPNNNLPSLDSGNSANYWNFSANTNTTGKWAYPLTDVAAYTHSASAYGTYDQGGNVLEHTDTFHCCGAGVGYLQIGGAWNDGASSMSASSNGDWGQSGNFTGFRVATVFVPEPTTVSLVTSFSFVLWFRVRMRRSSVV